MNKLDEKELKLFIKKLEKLVLKYGKTIMLEQISQVIDISINHSHNHIHTNPSEYTKNCCCVDESISDEELIKQKHEEYHHKN